jgi:small ubiquitin-related modifier
VYFKVKKTTTFKKIFEAYLQRVGKAPGSVRFMFDGQRVQAESTPDSLGMEDEDTIDAMVRVDRNRFCS